MRKIPLVLDKPPLEWTQTQVAFPNNRIRTTKYTLLSFFPIALMNQLLNVVNIFYIVKTTLNSIKVFSTNSPLASGVPLLWVITMGMILELIPDLKRWSQDKKINQYEVQKVKFENR